MRYNRRPERFKKAMRSINGRKRSGKPCGYCGRIMKSSCDKTGLAVTTDHYMPKSKGGSNRSKNRVQCCRACNEIKADLMPDEWREFRAANPRWWVAYGNREVA